MNLPINTAKYRDIFDAGKKLFWKYGIKKVTIEEICQEANASKMTFYKFFPNKVALAKTILDELMDSSLIKLNHITKSELPFSEKLKELFLMKMEGMNNFSMEFINDIYLNPKLGLSDHLDILRENSKNHITEFYKDSQRKGYIRQEVNIDFILVYSTQVIKMMENEHLLSQYAQPQDFIIEAMNMLFYGIVSGNE